MTNVTGDAQNFPDTEWSHIVDLGGDDEAARAASFERILRRYWPPVFHYLKAVYRSSHEDAEDMAQGFFAMMIGRMDFATLSPERGRFRTFLKVALRRYVAGEGRKASARLHRAAVPIEEHPHAAEVSPGTPPPEDPEAAFEREWAACVLRDVHERLREELRRLGKEKQYQIFVEYCLDPADDVSYDTLALKHGLKADDVRNYLRFVRQRGRELVREAVRSYLVPGEDVDAELREILGQAR
jgi:RNA polymerase sigma-70 factor (ECF subfamily)